VSDNFLYEVIILIFSKGVALQLYNCAHLLLILNRPSRGGLAEYMGLVKLKRKFVANICGIAMTLNDYASSVLSSQCLYIGMGTRPFLTIGY
jgi:hypothetical protein